MASEDQMDPEDEESEEPEESSGDETDEESQEGEKSESEDEENSEPAEEESQATDDEDAGSEDAEDSEPTEEESEPTDDDDAESEDAEDSEPTEEESEPTDDDDAESEDAEDSEPTEEESEPTDDDDAESEDAEDSEPASLTDEDSEDAANAASLDAAMEDADQTLGEEEVGECVEHCSENAPLPAPAPGITPPSPPPPSGPGDLEVTVLDGKSGLPIPDADVDISGPESKSNKTDASGKVTFRGIQPGAYTINAKKKGYAPGGASARVFSQSLSKAEIKLAFACWIDDYDKTISVNSYGRYFRKYKADGTELSFNFPKKYKVLVPLKSGGKITVEVRFKEEVQTGCNAADATAAKTKLETGVRTHWTGKFTLEVEDPECGKKSFSIDYKVVWVTSGEDYTLKIHRAYPREGLTGNVMNVSKSTSAWTYAHEFAHCTGIPDEYSYSTQTEKVRYLKPDGTLDDAVSAPPGGKAATAADATIMSAVNNTKTLKRHGWNIAIEVQQLLRDQLGREIKCTIK